MSQVTEIARPTLKMGAEISIQDPTSYFEDPAKVAELKALVDERLVVFVKLGAAPSADSLNALRMGFGGPPGPWNDDFVPYRQPVAPYNYMTDIDVRANVETEPPGPHVLSWLENFHFDGQSIYTVVVDLEGRPFGPNRYRDMARIYADLPDRLKKLVTGATAISGPMPHVYRTLAQCEPFDPATATQLPLVVRHPRSGLPVLRPPRHPLSHIAGLPVEEGRAVLEELWSIVEASEHRFEVFMGEVTLVVWDGVRVGHTNPLFERHRDRRQWFFTVPGATKELPAY